MAALWTTRPETDRKPPVSSAGRWLGANRPLVAWVSVVLVGIVGCSGGHPGDEPGPPPDPSPYRPVMRRLPPPSPDRIGFRDGTLSFYELPASGRWMVQVSGSDTPEPVGPDHRLPGGVNPQSTFVSYCRPGGQTSQRVSLAEIQAAGRYHDSQVR